MSMKNIHIEKYNFGTFEKEGKPYVMVRTQIIQSMTMKYAKEFLLWAYLESLPPTWKPCKKHLTNHFNISERTYEYIMASLHKVGLIEYRQNRLPNGSFGKGHLIVLDGSKFNIDADSKGSHAVKITTSEDEKEKVIHRKQENRTAKICGAGKTSTDRASIGMQEIPPDRKKTGVRWNCGHINTTIKNNKEKKKIKSDVSVFFDALSVKNYAEKIIEERGILVEEEILDEIVYYSYVSNPEKEDMTIIKRINIALKKIREGKWNIPNGYGDISYSKIKQREEAYYAEKEENYKKDAKAIMEIKKKIITPLASSAILGIKKLLG